MADLCQRVGYSATGRPVIDKTGLTGKYDFTLSYDMAKRSDSLSPAASDPLLTIEQAVEQQLGLRLVESREPLDTVVIDRAERVPVEN
jgi:uncharacterized protein (TIGR03435 family)